MSSSSVVRPGRSCERCHAVKLTFVILSLVCATPACAAPTTTLVARDGSGDRANAGPGAVAVWVSEHSSSTFSTSTLGGCWKKRSCEGRVHPWHTMSTIMYGVPSALCSTWWLVVLVLSVDACLRLARSVVEVNIDPIDV